MRPTMRSSMVIAIFALPKEKGVQVTVHLYRRWDRDFVLVQHILQQGLLGDVYRIELRYTGFSAEWAGWGLQGMDNPWRLKNSFGGGILSDWSPHLFYQLLLLAHSPINTIFGKQESRIWTQEVEDHFWAEVIFRNGLSARVEASNNHRFPLPRWLLLGSKGTLEMDGGDPGEWNRALIRKRSASTPPSSNYPAVSTRLFQPLFNRERNRQYAPEKCWLLPGSWMR